ncbi:MAG TPA: hypothetical protein VFD41_13980, partial [Actinomycetales bacterium]|nr:hypothetical protein [Actinomycetales bacterium]
MSRALDRRGVTADVFLVGDDAEAVEYFSAPGLRVDVASPRDLLAMKLFAARPESDADDIRSLYQLLDFTTVEEGLDLVEAAYPGRPVPTRVQYLLEEIVTSL